MDVMQHMENHKGELNTCKPCPETSSTKTDWDEHEREHFKERSDSDIATDEVSQKNVSINSLRSHDLKKTFSCEFCSKIFPFKSTLKEHRLTHTGEQPYECDICQKRFRRNGDLTKHILTHPGEKPFKCGKCDWKSSTKASLTLHIRSHIGEKPFECDICNKTFAEKRKLGEHIGNHTGEKPFKCDMCARKYTIKDSLLLHIRCHIRDKPFECDVCKKRYLHKGKLANHILIHTGDKPHICGVCHKSFRCKDHLVTHLRTHTGERPYDCEKCEVSFKQHAHLKTHIKSHDRYRCDVCPQTFPKKSILDKHKKNHIIEKSQSTKKPQPFVSYSSDSDNAIVTFKSENLLNRVDISGNIPVIPDIVNIGNGGEHVESRSQLEIDHNRTYSGEKLYKYDACQQDFSCKRNHDFHITADTEERPLASCFSDADSAVVTLNSNNSLNGKDIRENIPVTPAFVNIRNGGELVGLRPQLTIHNQTHTGEKPHICDACDKKFSCKRDLDFHITTHTEEGSFDWNMLCKMSSKYITDLQSRMRTVRDFSCERNHTINPTLCTKKQQPDNDSDIVAFSLEDSLNGKVSRGNTPVTPDIKNIRGESEDSDKEFKFKRKDSVVKKCLDACIDELDVDVKIESDVKQSMEYCPDKFELDFKSESIEFSEEFI